MSQSDTQDDDQKSRSNDPQAKPDEAVKRRPGEKAPVDLASALEDLAFSARGLVAALDATDVFSKHNISAEEWGVLRTLIGRREVPMRVVMVNAGVPRGRLRGVVSSLQMKGMIAERKPASTDKPSGGDRPAGGAKQVRTLSATERAAELRPAVSSRLKELLGNSPEKHGKAFARAAKAMNRLQRSMRRTSKTAGRRAADMHEDDEE